MRLVECLVTLVMGVKVVFAIDNAREPFSVVILSKPMGASDVLNSNQLLIKFTRSIMEAAHRTDISLIDIQATGDIGIRRIFPIVTKQLSLVRCPTAETVHENNRVVVAPQRSRKQIVTDLISLSALAELASLLSSVDKLN